MYKTIALKPRLNEKTYGLANSRVYVFDIDKTTNKHVVKRAVEAQFEEMCIRDRITTLVVVIVVAAVGTYLLLGSHAAVPYACLLYTSRCV